MLTRKGHGLSVTTNADANPPRIVPLSDDAGRPAPLRKFEGYISRAGEMPEGFAWYVVIGPNKSLSEIAVPGGASAIFLPKAFGYLGTGDLIRVFPEKGDIAVLFSAVRTPPQFSTDRAL